MAERKLTRNEAYEKALSEAWQVRNKADDAAWAVYRKAQITARRAFDKTMDKAYQVYKEETK